MKPHKIKELRKKLGLDHKQFGDLIGAAESTVYQYETEEGKAAHLTPGRKAQMLIRQQADKIGFDI